VSAEEPFAARLLVAVAASLWAVLVPGQAGRFMDQPLRWRLHLPARPWAPRRLRPPAPVG
jgi:hypothetical protein